MSHAGLGVNKLYVFKNPVLMDGLACDATMRESVDGTTYGDYGWRCNAACELAVEL